MHIYSIRGPDEPSRTQTTWYAAEAGNEIEAICLLFTQFAPHALLALREPADTAKEPLLEEILSHLPDTLCAHLGPGLEDAVETYYKIESHKEHFKMYLRSSSRLTAVQATDR